MNAFDIRDRLVKFINKERGDASSTWIMEQLALIHADTTTSLSDRQMMVEEIINLYDEVRG